MFVTTLLLSTALAAPAFAQIEQVVVTAQKRAEDIQTVPIAITAFTAQDLAAHQITMAKDLQFATPNVTYTKTNFSGDDFSIRGIGNDVITGGGESGVAVDFDNIYLAGAILDLSSFYDLERVEVLEGPQSTLYGRGATAGTVNIIPAKPDLEQAFVNADASFGNYSAMEDKLTINIPIVTDELGLRVAADFNNNSGIITNVYNGDHIDADHDYSVRATLRWQPTDATTIDIIGQEFHKNDTTMRAQRQQCLYDPSGTLGCLPGGLANEGINNNAFFSADLASKQSFQDVANQIAQLTGGLLVIPDAGALGIVDLQQQAGEVHNPNQAFDVNTDFRPTWNADDNFLAINAKQRAASWLDVELNAGYDHGSTTSQESYNNTAPQLLNEAQLGTYGPAIYGSTAEGTLYDFLAAVGGPAYAAFYAPLLTAHPGELPASGLSGLGLSTNNVKYYTNSFSTYDQSNAEQEQYSIDLEAKSHLDGPLNFMLGAFYLRQEAWGDYYVSSGAQGYASLALGGLYGLLFPACATAGCSLAPAYYDNSSPQPGGITLKSESMYGEVYYDIVPDLLKLTLGARWTDDYKSQQDRILLVNTVTPLGANSNNAVGVPYQFQDQSWSRITGHAVLDYTPKLDFTDQTLIYASYARGYKAGGFNPGLSTFAQGSGVPATYQPEGIDAVELGTKNLLLNTTLQANLTAWYYNYEGLQISQILDNDSINTNVSSRMYGSEGQFVYAPDDKWLFSVNFGYTNSSLGNNLLVDPRNPTNGAKDAVLIKDATPSATAAQNCAVYLNGATVAPGDNGALNATLAAAGLPTYFAPPGGSAVLAPDGIPLTNYGTCNPAFFTNTAVIGLMKAFGYSFTEPGHPQNGPGGVLVNLQGNENPNTPPWTLSFGAQYTFNVGNDYTLVPRVDVYYQTQMWGRVFEDPADKISGYTVTNAQIQLNAPDSAWYVQGFVKNVFNRVYVTGEYLTSSSSGLYTNQFLGDPRMYGVRVGVHF